MSEPSRWRLSASMMLKCGVFLLAFGLTIALPAVAAVDLDGDGFDTETDCDDSNPDVNPDATEIGNGIDDDCDGTIDIGAGGVFIPAVADDLDGDGYDEDVDCDDSNSAVYPGALEICNGIDDDCDGDIDFADSQFNDPDDVDIPSFDDDGDGELDEGFGFCVYNTDALCITGGRLTCIWPPGGVTVAVPGLGTLTCDNDPSNIIYTAPEVLGDPSCSDGINNDCDTVGAAADGIDNDGDGEIDEAGEVADLTDLDDPDCQEPERCDGLDNDGDGEVDENWTIGAVCYSGVGECERVGTYACDGDYAQACSAIAGNPKNEGSQYGQSCDDGDDNDCDGFTDTADADCDGYGDPELCGNGEDDDGDGLIDEGFPTIGLPCSEGVGACATIGTIVCDGGTGTTCGAVAGLGTEESEVAGNCGDAIDNDCDGFTDSGDGGCSSAYDDLGVTCSLPYTHAFPGGDCTGKHLIVFDGGQATTVQADLLALDTAGNITDIIENVGLHDTAHLASRLHPDDYRVDSKQNKRGWRHTVYAPMPLLRVTGTNGSVEDVAYCSIMPYLEVTEPDGMTISLSEGDSLDVGAFLPLVDVDTLGIMMNGIDLLYELGIDPLTDFPTNGTPLCQNSGDCVFQIEAGCGDGSMVDIHVLDLIVEGLDTDLAPSAKSGSAVPEQVNTLSFNVSGLPAGGHIFYIEGSPLPLLPHLSAECLVDDLTDTGTASAFGINIDSPTHLEVVASAPVYVQGAVCGGNEITRTSINGKALDVSIPANQTCIVGDGMTSADECVVIFNEPMGQTDLALASAGNAPGGTFKRGSNRIIADASDDLGNRTFNTDIIFGLGDVQSPAAIAGMNQAILTDDAIDQAIQETREAMAVTIDPAFVAGLEEAAVQDFFNEKCSEAIDQFTARATATLNGKNFGSIDVEPGCSCDLTVQVTLRQLIFTESTADPKCAVDFRANEIGVTVNLPDIFVEVWAHDSCTDHGLFGECIARTYVDVRSITKVEDISFDFFITETQIETLTPPDTDAFTFAWTVKDHNNAPLFLSLGTCSGGSDDGDPCYGDPMCEDGGTCVGVLKNPAYDAISYNNSGIECWGAWVCTAFQVVAAVIIEVFTLGFADGFDIVDFIDVGEFEFEAEFLDELTASEPDAMELNEVQVDPDLVAEAGPAAFTPILPVDVEIENGGMTITIGADFYADEDDPSIDDTTGASLTPARAPTVGETIAAGDEITMMVADDVFGQIYAALKESGALQAFCTDLDGKTVGDLLPASCATLGGDNLAGATIRGICYAVRGTDCTTIVDGGGGQTNTAIGVCTGFGGGDCSALPFGQRVICNATPARNIRATDGLLLCARDHLEPDLLIHEDDASDHTVDTDLLLNDLSVVFALDRAGDGYAGDMDDLDGCFGQAGDAAGDCRVVAVCADLTLKTTMGIDSTRCGPNEAGFVFSLNQVIASEVGIGNMCNSATDQDDTLIFNETLDSVVIDTVSDASEAFTPPFCVEGFTLGGVLDFTSSEAKLFGLTTDGGTGFADYLGITVGLGPPTK